MVLIGIVPGFNQSISDRVACGVVSARIVEVESGLSACIFDMVDNGALD